MELSLITPITHLDYSYLLSGRFCLASVAFEYPEYLEFFVDASNNNYNVILDTGTFENETLNINDYLRLVQQIVPTIVVAPDIIGEETSVGWERACNFNCLLKERWQGEKIYDGTGRERPVPEVMYVPQTKRGDLVSFEHVLELVVYEPRIKWIGICRDAVYNAYGQFTQTKNQELNRFYFASRLQQLPVFKKLREAGKKFHFLGVGDYVYMLQYYWFVDSLDTASFFWQGYLGNVVTDDGILATLMKRPKDYFTRPFPNLDPDSEQGLSRQDKIHYNCVVAAQYANMALDLRKEIEVTRI